MRFGLRSVRTTPIHLYYSSFGQKEKRRKGFPTLGVLLLHFPAESAKRLSAVVYHIAPGEVVSRPAKQPPSAVQRSNAPAAAFTRRNPGATGRVGNHKLAKKQRCRGALPFQVPQRKDFRRTSSLRTVSTMSLKTLV